MTFQIITTAQAAANHGVKVCVHSRAGMGKTTLCATAPNPIILSCESGMLALQHLQLPCIVITSWQQVFDVYRYLAFSADAKKLFYTVCLDSISEIAEVLLSQEKGVNKDPRKAYGEMQDQMSQMIRAFRDLPGYHVYFSAKQRALKDDMTGVTVYGPSMPGQQLGPQLPYFFDEVFCLDIAKDQAGRDFRYLRTKVNQLYEAKDRSGALDEYEPPNLTHIFDKIANRRKAA